MVNNVDLRPAGQTEPFPPLRVLSLCTGAGALELGINLCYPALPVAYVEGEAYAAANLVALMEKGCLDPTPIWDNLRTFDPLPWAGNVDLVAAGIPCVSWSRAGAKKGGQDERDLTGELVRVVDGAQPALVFVENVVEFVRSPGRAVGGLHELAAELHRLGYQMEEPRIESAARAGSPTQRNRAFFLFWERSAHSLEILRVAALGMRRVQEQFWREVADSYGVRREALWEGRPGSGVEARHDTTRRRARLGARLAEPIFPPGPASGEWLYHSPQPGILGKPVGPAPWVDRTRLLGNSVCAVAAARAFYTLVCTAARSNEE